MVLVSVISTLGGRILVYKGKRCIHLYIRSNKLCNHKFSSSSTFISISISNMSFTFNVFRGSKGAKIVPDKVTRELRPHEVFIETTHTGLCGTDQHYVESGQVLGHEGVGLVRAVGSAVVTAKVGDRVGFGYMHEVCGHCDNCITGKLTICNTPLPFKTIINKKINRMGPVLQRTQVLRRPRPRQRQFWPRCRVG